jgi:hypothetical protein
MKNTNDQDNQIEFIRSLVHDAEQLRTLSHSYKKEAEVLAEMTEKRDEIIEALQDDSPHGIAIAKRLFSNFFGI